MLQRREALTVGDARIGTRFQQGAHGFAMPLASVPEHNCLHESGPTEVVDMVERCARLDQLSDNSDVTKVGRRDQCSSVVRARDQLWASATREKHFEGRNVIPNGDDRHGIIALVVEEVRICSCRKQSPYHSTVPGAPRRGL